MSAASLSRGFPPPAPPIRRDPPFPDFAFPGHVASTHLSCASTPCSLDGLPGVLSTRCAFGTNPSELDLTEIATPLSVTSPPAIGFPTAVADARPAWLLSLRACQDWPSRRPAHRMRPVGLIPLGHWRSSAFGAWALLPQRLRSRGFIPLPVGAYRRRISPRAVSLALLGFLLLGALPFRVWASTATTPRKRGYFVAPQHHASRADVPTRAACAWPPLGTSGHSRAGSCSLCFRVSKNREGGVASPEAAGP
jgi:hypothetical protein